MKVNRFKPHVLVIPEDDANRQLVNGFIEHPAISNRRAIGIENPAGGWGHLLTVFEEVFVPHLRSHPTGHAVLLLDFDEEGETRRAECEAVIPDDVKSRVFILGTSDEPEDLRRELQFKKTLEQIGMSLAQDCDRSEFENWNHPHLAHNRPELERMIPLLKSILFGA